MNRQFGAFTGLAMLLIVLNHSIGLGFDSIAGAGGPRIPSLGTDILHFFQALGAFAVPIFFFISGSFVAYAAQGDPPRLPRKFLWSSLRHIIVPYAIWSILFYVLLYFQYEKEFTILGYLKNLLVGYPYHFVPLIVFYYLLSPILVVFARRYPAALLILVGLYQLFSINVVYPGYLGFTFPEWARWFALPVLRTTIADWGIFFPLGLVYGMHAKAMLPWMKKYMWLLLSVSAILFLLGYLNALEILNIPIYRILCPLPFTLAIPAIGRDRIPWVRSFERIGRRSYGLYLTHLIVLDLVVLLISSTLAGLLRLPLLLFPILFALGVIIPIAIMEMAARGPIRPYYRLIFG